MILNLIKYYVIIFILITSCSTNHIAHEGFKVLNKKLKIPQDIVLEFDPTITININEYQAEYFNQNHHTEITKYKNYTIDELKRVYFFPKEAAKYKLKIKEVFYTEDVNYTCIETEEKDEVCDYLNHLTVKIIGEIYLNGKKIKTLESFASEKSKIKKNIIFDTYNENSLSFKIEDMNTRCIDKLINKTTRYFNKKIN